MMEKEREKTTNTDPAFDEYKHKYYKDLKEGEVKVKFSEEVFKCPYCPQSRKYSYTDLLRHASRIARESKSATLKDKAKHMGLEKYIERDLKDPNETLIQNVNKEFEIAQEKVNKVLEKFMIEHDESKLQLEDREKKMNELAMLEQKKANDTILKLAEEHKIEKEKLHNKIIELQKQLDDKQQLELEKENNKTKEKIESIQEELKEKEEKILELEEVNQILLVKDRLSNDELQDARKKFISGLKEIPANARANICLKRMGELDAKPFMAAAKRHGSSKVEQNPIKLVSLWEEHLKDPEWHPYKVIITGDECEEVLDEEDEMLENLKAEYGDDVYNAVVTALKELNEYNPSGRCPVQELWNNKEKRKATLGEGVDFLLKQLKTKKQRK